MLEPTDTKKGMVTKHKTPTPTATAQSPERLLSFISPTCV